jgi:hypothetical protein
MTQKEQNKSVVTVVTGLPRSGTSMLMQMLAAGGMPVLTDGVRTPDAANPRGYFEFEPVKGTRRNSRWLAEAPGKVVKLVHLLVPELPGSYDYRVLLIHRNIAEVLASQAAMLRDAGRAGADLPPERLAEIFAAQLERVGRWIEQQPHFSMLRLDFHQVIADPLAHAARINQFLGGGLDEQKMAAAVEPGLYRRRREG